MIPYSKLKPLPVGSVTARGFLRDQLLRSKDGMGGRLYELEPEMIAYPYVDRKPVKGWSDVEQAGWAAEISGNYWTGYILLAFALGDDQMIERATEWVDGALKNQREDGYLGTYVWEGDDVYDDFNGAGTSCGMRALLCFYEATGRRDVLEAVHRCMLWFCENWAGDRKTSYCGGYLIEPMTFCYFHTGDERLIRFAEEYAEYQCEHDIFKYSYKAFLNEEFQYNSCHTAGLGIMCRLPALLYAATGKTDYLKATAKVMDETYEKATQLSGSPCSDAEYLSPVGSTTETEYCCYAYYNESNYYMSYITGDSKYGDRMEEAFYNGAQGARKKDERAIAYFSSPNQIFATSESSNYGDYQLYTPCYPVACCPVNSVVLLGDFVRGMILTDDDGNFYANAYGPCAVKYNGVEIEEVTEYPFRNEVVFKVKSGGKFKTFLRVPGWCEEYAVELNGEKIDARRDENGFIEAEKDWKAGDSLKITFKEEVKIVRVNDDIKKRPIAIKRGALLYSLHIGEVWNEIPGHPTTPLPDGWSWYGVFPYYEEPKCDDYHERIGLRRYQYDWNVALDERLTADDVEVETVETDGYAWEEPKVKLRVPAWKAPYFSKVYGKRTPEPYEDKQKVTEKITLTLVPYGCTNLRMTYFPIADLGERD